MSKITSVSALEILDSRGHPTVSVTVRLDSGQICTAGVPSGASTGTREAVELRDGDLNRYGGKGVLKAIENVESEIAHLLVGREPFDQSAIDHDLIRLDGTPNKARLGANAILGASMAVARAAAEAWGVPLYHYLGGDGAVRLPVPCFNVLNGGKHADNGLDFQEYMIVPIGAPTFGEALRYGSQTYSALKRLVHDRGYSTAIGDEGGFAPSLPSNEAPCELIVEAIQTAGFRPGEDIAIALDPAASSFGHSGRYEITGAGGGSYDRAAMLDLYQAWVQRYPIISIEDGFAEDDWEGFVEQTRILGDRIQIVGDDLFVTNPEIIRRGVEERAANAALIKLNQIGTVSETVAAVNVCLTAGWRAMISHRSGETPDDFIADFAVAMGTGEIKSGAPARGERLAKYNRLLAIERELGSAATYGWGVDRAANQGEPLNTNLMTPELAICGMRWSEDCVAL